MDAKKKKLLIIGSIVLGIILIGVGIVVYIVFSLPKPQPDSLNEESVTQNSESDVAQVEEKHISFLDGTEIDTDKEQVLGVIIENYIDSRPQMVGLNEASLVFEAEAEGGITRFLALFPYQSLERVGPVRSARPYYVSWAEMFDAGIVHAGGSTNALSSIYSSGRVFDLDCLALEGGLKNCFRDYLYYAPHNLFANLKDLRELLSVNKWDKPLDSSFFMYGPLSATVLEGEDNNASTIHLYYPFPEYFVKWTYDKTNNQYLRFQGEALHMDHLNNQQVSAVNIVIMFTDYYVLDDAGRLSMKVDGTGQLFMFRDGKVIPGTWKKADDLSKIKFYDEDGVEMLLNPGKTWISVINSKNNVQFE